MKLNEINKLSSAVRLALMGSVAAFGAAGTAHAQNADNSAPQTQKQNLETIVVTGSNIRRVDVETANPVITIDKAEIAKTGAATIGDLIQQLPTNGGSYTSQAVNNGGGSGAATISLRGLGSARTLILINGHRLITNDVNTIPVDLIERVEVLGTGASAVYGSDAIGGVVNFILRKDYQGAELVTGFGESSHDDDERKNFTLTFGAAGDRGSVMGSIGYNKNTAAFFGNRSWGALPLDLESNGTTKQAGSLVGPGGLMTGPAFAAACPNSIYGAGTYDPTSSGQNGLPKGWRCYNSGTSNSLGDNFNYEPYNYIYVPSERTNVSLFGNYKLSDNVEAYMEFIGNKTVANSQLAPTPIDLYSDGVTISANNPYNPFGANIGKDDASYDDAMRATALGARSGFNSDLVTQMTAGLRGTFGSSSWNWNAFYSLGNEYDQHVYAGLPNFNAMTKNGALGDNCVMPTAGEALSSLGTSTCLNIMDQFDPDTEYLMKKYYSQSVFTKYDARTQQAQASVNGTLFSWAPGDVNFAGGVEYRNYSANETGETDAIEDQYGNCSVPASGCFVPYSGSYNVKEAYGELLVPLLKDAPFANSLNVDIGYRYSKYSSFGSTNNWKVSLEWKPIEDLLVRGTAADVFRAPGIGELFAPLAYNYASYSNVTAPNGTVYTSKNGSQLIVEQGGATVFNYPIKPEQGKSYDVGFVYDPHFVEGLSLSVDFWRIILNDVIGTPTAQQIVTECANDNFSAAICNQIQFVSGSTTNILQITNVATQNLGTLTTQGVDFGGRYRLQTDVAGTFNFGLQATYLAKFNVIQAGSAPDYAAGTFDSTWGLLPRWRALANVDWTMGDFFARWQTRYVGRANMEGVFGFPYDLGAWASNDVSFGYNIQPLNTTVEVGINNLGDRAPNFTYQAQISNNGDGVDYDAVGRFFWGRLTVKF
jgi:outer membrane receptor protein involved in Fe transport